ncbi:MAG: ABC transporter ATP-binding protein, partial [Bacteroidota bacterium]
EEFWALKDISFEVKRGEAIGIIGKNGAGKSTLLKVLSRITEPTTGRIAIDGRVSSLLEVGTGFHPELTGRENVFLNGTILGMSRTEVKAKFDEIVDFSGVEKFLDTPVKRYSSGMKVRLAFAVAAHLEPEILIIDEVLAVGDAEFQKKCLGKMEDVTGEGRTVLFVSHNMAAVKALCSRAILIKQGQVVTAGEIESVVASYLKSNNSKVTHITPGLYDLRKREKTDSKVGHLIVEELKLLNSEGKTTDTYLMGEQLKLIISMAGLSNFKGANIGVIFKTSSDQWITSFTTTMRPLITDETRDFHEDITLTIPRLPFTVGEAFIDISISQPGAGRLDYVERAAIIRIEGNDIYENGTLVDRYFGLVYIDGEWGVERTYSVQ